MARLVALRPGAVAIVVDLAYFAYRLEFGATLWNTTPCFSLVYSYPPSPMGTYVERTFVSFAAMARVALARLPVEFAQNEAELENIARAANESDSVDVLKTRTVEAFQLFRNNARISKTQIDESAAHALQLALVAWEIRDWMVDGMTEKKEWSPLGTRLIGQP